ncbi:MAG: RNA methyltransferase [Lentisphaerota bacterium]
MLNNIRVVLISPIYGGNVGSVCRAMLNMGVSDLAIAAPRPEFDYNEARKMACHADRVLDGRKTYPTLAEAVADCGLVAGTSAREGLYRGHAKTPREWAPRLLEAASASKVALVFGPEDNGMSNEDLALCTQIVRIPSTEEYPSLNLSHAVLLCCYELHVASGLVEPLQEVSEEAPSAMREAMFEKWRHALMDIGFMKDDKADHMMLGLRRILSRGSLTRNDVQILLGMASQTIWCAGQMKKNLPTQTKPET